MTHISKNEFETVTWLPVKDRFNQSISSIVFNYFTKKCPHYLNKVFELACLSCLRTTNSYLRLMFPFQKLNTEQNTLSFLGPSIWKKIPDVLKKKKNNSINIFKDNFYNIT